MWGSPRAKYWSHSNFLIVGIVIKSHCSQFQKLTCALDAMHKRSPRIAVNELNQVNVPPHVFAYAQQGIESAIYISELAKLGTDI